MPTPWFQVFRPKAWCIFHSSLSSILFPILSLPNLFWLYLENIFRIQSILITCTLPPWSQILSCFLDYYRSSCFCSCIIITTQHTKWSCKNLAVPLPRTPDPQIYWHGSFSNLFQVFIQMCSQWCLLWSSYLSVTI